ncbi:MAG: hypothetical protein WCV59_02770 [Parcubacteria group bacterium]
MSIHIGKFSCRGYVPSEEYDGHYESPYAELIVKYDSSERMQPDLTKWNFQKMSCWLTKDAVAYSLYIKKQKLERLRTYLRNSCRLP